MIIYNNEKDVKRKIQSNTQEKKEQTKSIPIKLSQSIFFLIRHLYIIM